MGEKRQKIVLIATIVAAVCGLVGVAVVIAWRLTDADKEVSLGVNQDVEEWGPERDSLMWIEEYPPALRKYLGYTPGQREKITDRGFWSDVGLAAFYEKRFEIAVDCFNWLVVAEENNATARINLASSLIELERGVNPDFSNALHHLDVATRLGCNSPNLPNARGVIHYKEGNLDSAKCFFDEALERDPTLEYVKANLDACT